MRAVAGVRDRGVGSVAVAEILALVAAFFFALAATLQQKGALGMGEVSLGSPSSFVKLVKQPWWLAGPSPFSAATGSRPSRSPAGASP